MIKKTYKQKMHHKFKIPNKKTKNKKYPQEINTKKQDPKNVKKTKP